MAAGQGPLEVSVTVRAPADAVWAVVSDLRGMKDLSPELVGTWFRGEPRVGTRAVTLNRRRWFVWPTTLHVTRFKPPTHDGGHAVLAFWVWPTRAEWSYELTPTEDGTVVTEKRTDPEGTSLVVRAAARILGGAASHDVELLDGMRVTLERVRRRVEPS